MNCRELGLSGNLQNLLKEAELPCNLFDIIGRQFIFKGKDGVSDSVFIAVVKNVAIHEREKEDENDELVIIPDHGLGDAVLTFAFDQNDKTWVMLEVTQKTAKGRGKIIFNKRLMAC